MIRFSMDIRPLFGTDQATFGMSEEQLVTRLGPPSESRAVQWLAETPLSSTWRELAYESVRYLFKPGWGLCVIEVDVTARPRIVLLLALDISDWCSEKLEYQLKRLGHTVVRHEHGDGDWDIEVAALGLLAQCLGDAIETVRISRLEEPV
jgi:hypothetical protein